MSTKPLYLFSTSSHPDATHINSLDIELLNPEIDFSKYDYLIITSKQTSNALKKYYKDAFKHTKALCISEKSAEAFEEIGGEVLAIGRGYGDNLVDIIQKYPKERKWLYLRAEVVASDFVKVCTERGYDIDEVVVYRSCCSSEIVTFDLKTEATLIFTSPSSVKCFLKNNTFTLKHKIIVIGKSTAKVLPEGVEYTLSQDRTIQSCIDIK